MYNKIFQIYILLSMMPTSMLLPMHLHVLLFSANTSSWWSYSIEDIPRIFFLWFLSWFFIIFGYVSSIPFLYFITFLILRIPGAISPKMSILVVFKALCLGHVYLLLTRLKLPILPFLWLLIAKAYDFPLELVSSIFINLVSSIAYWDHNLLKFGVSFLECILITNEFHSRGRALRM